MYFMYRNKFGVIFEQIENENCGPIATLVWYLHMQNEVYKGFQSQI